jgi:hypothetical protein
MTRVSGSAALALLVGGVLGAASCSSSSDPPHGAPILTGVYLSAAGASYTIWSPPGGSGPSQVTSVPALGSEVDFVFNRRLDGNRIEDTVNVGGVSTEQPKAMPPITVTGFDPQASTPPFVLDVLYNSAGVFGDGTSYVMAKPRVPGFPSATSLTFQIDRSNITSPYGEPLAMPDIVPVTTQPFSVEIRIPGVGDGGAGPPVEAGSFQVPLHFSNVPGPTAQLLPFVHVRAGGDDLPVSLLADALDVALLRLVPAGGLTAWPPGATIDVTVDPGLPDAFGVGLAASATASFATSPGASPSDGGAD